jgi:hypothetical protein
VCILSTTILALLHCTCFVIARQNFLSLSTFRANTTTVHVGHYSQPTITTGQLVSYVCTPFSICRTQMHAHLSKGYIISSSPRSNACGALSCFSQLPLHLVILCTSVRPARALSPKPHFSYLDLCCLNARTLMLSFISFRYFILYLNASLLPPQNSIRPFRRVSPQTFNL